MAVADPGSGITRFTYDANGNLLTIRDAKGNTTTYAYNAMDQVESRTDARSKTETFTYDGNGNLTAHSDRKGQATTFSYDALNRRSGVTGSGYSVTYTWDAGNRVTQAVDSAGGTVTRAWGLLDRLTTETTALGVIRYDNPGIPNDRGYDTLGRRLWMEVPGQSRVTYTWDAASRLTELQQGSQVVTFAYDNANRRTLLTLPNNVSTEYLYDLDSRLTGLIYRNAQGELGRITHTYDNVGSHVNAAGSFAATMLPAAVTNGTYDMGNRLLTFGPKTLSYDDNGNLTEITENGGVTAVTWDSRNRLTALSGPGPTTAAFAYDALGRRSSKQVNGVATEFQYDGLQLVKEIVGGVASGYLNGATIDEPLVRNSAEFYGANAIGSVLFLTDAAGLVGASYKYDPFGRVVAEGSPSSNTLHFTGRENDGTGFYHYRARYYHPGLARFISEDPIEFTGGDVNLYAYVGNKPLTYVDPFGTAEILVCGHSVNIFGSLTIAFINIQADLTRVNFSFNVIPSLGVGADFLIDVPSDAPIVTAGSGRHGLTLGTALVRGPDGRLRPRGLVFSPGLSFSLSPVNIGVPLGGFDVDPNDRFRPKPPPPSICGLPGFAPPAETSIPLSGRK